MTRQLPSIALMFFAAVGVALASKSHGPPTNDKLPIPARAPEVAAAPQGPAVAAAGPAEDGIIGTMEGNSDAAPIGAPVAAGTFPDLPTAPAASPHNGAATFEVSAAASFAALACFVF